MVLFGRRWLVGDVWSNRFRQANQSRADGKGRVYIPAGSSICNLTRTVLPAVLNGAMRYSAAVIRLRRAASSIQEPTSRSNASHRAAKPGLSGVRPVVIRVIWGSIRG
jgi:hypothetical protein